jgi:hypothetical protein
MLENQPNMVFKKGGKMMVLWHGETRPLDLVMDLDNGARVDMDGTVTMPDGSRRTLSDGEALTMDGEPTTAVDAHARNKLDE